MMMLVGLALGAFCILSTLVAEHGQLGHFLSLPAFLIVAGGSLGATLIGFGNEELGQALDKARGFERRLGSRRNRAAGALARYAMIFRHQGALKLEKEIEKEPDPFLRAGLELIVQGTSQENLDQIMGLRIDRELVPLNTAERFFESLGGYSPTFGIVGTVMGLVGVLGHLSQPDQLAGGVAAAFVATFYGILFANLVFLPLSARFKHQARQAEDVLEGMLVGLSSVLRGEAPRTLSERLRSHSGAPRREENVAAVN